MSGLREGALRPRRPWVLVAIVVAAGIVLAPVGWGISDYVAQDNDFCNTCHLEPGVPLHAEIRRDFDAVSAIDLASVHRLAEVATRDDSEFRCIDCHGGTSWLGRARVKALAAKDAFWYLVGRFGEPAGMAWPLWDEDCRKCHAGFERAPSKQWETPRFHELAVHNADLGLDCVECHRVHDRGGNPDAHFLHADRVRTQCVRCHFEFEEQYSALSVRR